MLIFVLGLLSLLMPGKTKTYYIHPSNSQTIDAKLSRIVRFNGDGLAKQVRFFADCATDLIPEIPSDKLCSSLCISRRGCKSFNFNSALSICELVMTDYLLNNLLARSGIEADVAWTHRSVGPVSRGCETFSSDALCTFAWTSTVSTTSLTVDWKLPSDQDSTTDYLQDRQGVLLSNAAHRGQWDDFPALEVWFTMGSSDRRWTNARLIPGMKYEVAVKQFYRNDYLSQNPLIHVEVMEPARPVINDVTVTEHTVLLDWSIQGASDTVFVWNSPQGGSCTSQPNGYCAVDVKTKQLLVTGLVAGQVYTFSLRSDSHWKQSAVLQVNQALYTDVITYEIITTVDKTDEIILNINTESGVGSFHKVFLDGNYIIPRQPKRTFTLSQQFVFTDLTPGDYHKLDVTAYSRGEEPVTREYSYEVVTYPMQPTEYGNREFDQSWIEFNYDATGVIHHWSLKTDDGDCENTCTIDYSTKTYRVTNLTPGKSHKVELRTQVSYGLQTGDEILLSNPMTFTQDTTPAKPSIWVTGSSCYDAGIGFKSTGAGSKFKVYKNGRLHSTKPFSTNKQSINFGGLSAGKHYSFKIIALSESGTLKSEAAYTGTSTTEPDYLWPFGEVGCDTWLG